MTEQCCVVGSTEAENKCAERRSVWKFAMKRKEYVEALVIEGYPVRPWTNWSTSLRISFQKCIRAFRFT